ncbi:MAG: hypothetical protein LBL97_00325, partial [Prevotellaceae bacterium]|nr:hypothetical protein [Prevotellaceae bacterium]
RDTARTVAGIATGVLRIEAQTTNTTGDPRGTYVIDVSQTAPIDAFTINVMQDRGRAHYDMTAVEPKGLYLPVAYYGNGSVRKRYPMLKDVHYLLVTLRTLDSEDLNNTNATWTIKSVKPVNGYQFGGTGYFKDATVVSTATEHYTYTDVDGKPQSASLKVRYLQVKVPAVAPADVKNPAAGTYPLVGGYNYFDLTSDGTDLGNSGNPSEYKSVRIKVGYDTKSILMYSWYRGTYGYSTESGGSKAMLKAAVNYSLAGTVPVEGFTKKLVAVTEGLATQMPVTHGVPAAVAATTPPDIVILGLDNRFGSDAGTVMCNYINKGGVVILLSDGYYTASLKDNVAYIASRVVSNSTATTKLTSAANGGVGAIYDGGAGSIYPFLSTGDNAPAADDPILNGPFGNLRDKQWGEDGSATGFVKGITASDPVIVYSRDTKSRNNAGTDRGVSMFRSANKGFFFVGDGGFLSQASRSVGTNAIEPFAITATGQPTTRNYGYGYAAVVYNACLFANVMYWAIDYAQFYGPNSTTKAVGDYAPWFQ